MFDFTGKNVLITGGTRGIGKCILDSFAKANAKVCFLYSSSADLAREIEAEWAENGITVKGYKVDISNLEETRKVIKQVLADFGRIDILVNNAGITKDGYFMMMSEDSWNRVLDVNLNGLYNVTKSLILPFISNKSGIIVNLTSVSGIIGSPGQVNYSTTKAGIIGFTKSLSKELAAHGIRINAIAPGYIQTEMLDTIPEKMREGILKTIPVKKFGDVQDVANLAMFLSSDYANYIHGQTIIVDGGLTS